MDLLPGDQNTVNNDIDETFHSYSKTINVPFGEVEDNSQENRELSLENVQEAFSELMRKWNIDLTESEE